MQYVLSVSYNNIQLIFVIRYAGTFMAITMTLFSDIFLISAQNIDCWYSLKPQPQGGPIEFQSFMFWATIIKN